MKKTTLSVFLLLSGCASTIPEKDYAPELINTTQYVYDPTFRYLPDDRPSNWELVERSKDNNHFVISRSLDIGNYMWLTCKIDVDNVAALSLGVLQKDDLGKEGTKSTLTFSFDDGEILKSPAVMINSKNSAVRSYDPRKSWKIDNVDDRVKTIYEWLSDEGRKSQYSVVRKMIESEYVDVELQVSGKSRYLGIDLQGFSEAAETVFTECSVGI